MTRYLLKTLNINPMNQKILQLGLLPADRIVVSKSGLRIVLHHALYLGRNHLGVDLVAENKIGFGVRLITADDFFKDVTEVTRIEKFNGTNYQRKIAVQKALNKLGRSYHLIDYNCQHFANEIQYNRIKSDQVDGLFEGLKVAAGVAVANGLFYLLTIKF